MGLGHEIACNHKTGLSISLGLRWRVFDLCFFSSTLYTTMPVTFCFLWLWRHLRLVITQYFKNNSFVTFQRKCRITEKMRKTFSSANTQLCASLQAAGKVPMETKEKIREESRLFAHGTRIQLPIACDDYTLAGSQV